MELMVGLAIAMLLSLVTAQIFTNGTGIYRLEVALSRLEEKARLGTDSLGQDLRIAGFSGCQAQPGQAITNNLNTNYFYTYTQGVFGYNGQPPLSSLSPNLNIDLANAFTTVGVTPLTGTDVLTVWVAEPLNAQLMQAMSTQSALPLVSGTLSTVNSLSTLNGTLFPNDIAMISSCNSSSVFAVTAIQQNGASVQLSHAASGGGAGTNINASITSAVPAYLYDQYASIYRMSSRTYYIAQSLNPYYNKTGSLKTNSLFRYCQPSCIGDGAASSNEEIVIGADNVAFSYGLNTNTSSSAANQPIGATQYVSANSVGAANWANVISIKMNLLLTSTKTNLTSVNAIYTFNGNTYTQASGDLRLRKEITSLMTLRNRAP